MSVFNMAALDSFNKAICDNENAIVNVDRNNNDRIRQNGTFKSGNIFRWMRSPATKAANNEVRTQLLKSLGEAFGLNGMTTRSDGKVRFSQEFITDLRNRLGADLKIEDFGISRDGLVTSGKPLTVRRIRDIIDNAAASQKVFDVNVYKRKLDKVMSEMKSFDSTSSLGGLKDAGQCLSFLEKLGSNSLVREDPNYEYLYEASNDDEEREKLVRFQYYDVDKQEYVPMKTIEDLAYHLNHKDRLGMPVHLENQPFRPNKYTDDSKFDENALNKYIMNCVTNYIQFMVDLHDDCKKAGKLHEYTVKMNHPGGCMEQRIKNATDFKQELHVTELSDNEVDQVREMQRIADTGSAEPLHKCIFAELNAIITDPNAEQGDDWAAYADRIKKNLCGQKHPITEYFVNDEGKADFRPVMQNGKPLVREITAEDLDIIGPKIYESIYE